MVECGFLAPWYSGYCIASGKWEIKLAWIYVNMVMLNMLIYITRPCALVVQCNKCTVFDVTNIRATLGIWFHFQSMMGSFKGRAVSEITHSKLSDICLVIFSAPWGVHSFVVMYCGMLQVWSIGYNYFTVHTKFSWLSFFFPFSFFGHYLKSESQSMRFLSF